MVELIAALSEETAKKIDKDKRSKIADVAIRSEEHTSELQSQSNLVCRLLLEKKKPTKENPGLGGYSFASDTPEVVQTDYAGRVKLQVNSSGRQISAPAMGKRASGLSALDPLV